MVPSIPSSRRSALHQLSPAQERLVRLMQSLNFGRIEQLHIRSGLPVFDPAPQTTTEFKFGAENGPRQELGHGDFVLRAQVVEFFEQCKAVGDGVIETLSVKHGLPFSMTVKSSAAA